MNRKIEASTEEVYYLPSAEALLAGTLALMTGHAQACSSHTRQRMATKIVSNLSDLTQHPVLSPQFQAAVWNLRKHWEALQAQSAATATDPQTWHAQPSSLQ